MTTIFQAMNLAADQVERNPDLFHFIRWEVPKCGMPGCALGWIGHFLGFAANTPNYKIAEAIGFSPEQCTEAFYRRVTALVPGLNGSAQLCARGLRLYARKYHAPAPRTDFIPLVVRNILNGSHVVDVEAVL